MWSIVRRYPNASAILAFLVAVEAYRWWAGYEPFLPW